MTLASEQRRFAAHLRDPERIPPPPGIEPRRMAVYRDLFIANVSGLLATTFPVATRLLGAEAWQRLVRRFYAEHHAHTPYFHELPQEFVGWLAARDSRPAGEPPFLDELAHYEWVELALAVSDVEPDHEGVIPDGDLLAGCPVVSPLAWPLAYRWPVHRLSPDHQPTAAPEQPTFLVVYRDGDLQVRFLEVGPLAAALLEAIDRQPEIPGRTLLGELGADRDSTVLEELRAQGVILGARPVNWRKS